jgi:NAD(P) transhydrogenase subunit alpha
MTRFLLNAKKTQRRSDTEKRASARISSRCAAGALRLGVKFLCVLAASSPFLFITTAALAQDAEPHAAADKAASALPTMIFVFMLATFIGMGVITRVSRLLHTPLMSLTNAISAIAIVGAITTAGSEHPLIINLLGAIALFASTTNIVSGFLITDRMLKMFKRA